MLGGLFISKLTKIIKIREAYFFDLDPIDISQLNQIINQFSQISEKYFGIKQI